MSKKMKFLTDVVTSPGFHCRPDTSKSQQKLEFQAGIVVTLCFIYTPFHPLNVRVQLCTEFAEQL